ncbi:MAG: gliding motility-associated C-terminal domain-containing protein [Bacteroidia bacterium]
MKRSYIIFILLGILNLSSAAQVNLVPNPSFEDHTSCPFSFGDIPMCNSWSEPSEGTPDFMHACGSLLADVPANYFGWQYARTGEGYVGFGVYTINIATGDAKEYIQARLLDHLIAGKKYDCEFYASLADHSGFGIRALGMYFSDDSVYVTSPLNLPFTPQVVNTGDFISDTVNWTRVKGSFIATGSEKFVVIGTFEPSFTMDTIGIPGSIYGSGSYCYVDDVSVKCANCDLPPPNVFSPNNDGQNDHIDFSDYNLAEQIVTIYDRWGLKVFESSQNNTSWDGNDLKGNPCTEGVYYYVFHYAGFINTDYNNLNRKGFIQLIR